VVAVVRVGASRRPWPREQITIAANAEHVTNRHQVICPENLQAAATIASRRDGWHEQTTGQLQ
jgi:hypothetical protein